MYLLFYKNIFFYFIDIPPKVGMVGILMNLGRKGRKEDMRGGCAFLLIPCPLGDFILHGWAL